MTKEEKDIDRMLIEHTDLTDKIKQLEGRKQAETALLRNKMREIQRALDKKIAPLSKKRMKIRDIIMEYWERTHDDMTTIDFPSALVSRRNYRELTVHDPAEVLNALDRIGRLDFVEYVFKENKVARLYAEGKLKGINEEALDVTDNFNLQVRPRREHG